MDDSYGLVTKVVKSEHGDSGSVDDFKEVACCSDCDNFLQLKLPSFSPGNFSRLKCLERPWEHKEDLEIDIQPYYEKFCIALKEYQEDTLEEKFKEWSVDMQFLLPGITCCTRYYVDSLTDDSEAKTFDERLADWVEFGLSLEIAERFDSESLKHIELGCNLARRIFLMRRRQFASKLAARHILHRLVDIIESQKFSILRRCCAADVLFTSLFHCSATVPAFFNQIETDLAGKTCYARLTHLMLQKLPVRLMVALKPIVQFAGFAYSSFMINNLVRQVINNSLTDGDNEVLIKHLGLISDFILSNSHKSSVPSFYLFRILYETEMLSSLCVLITSTAVLKRTREMALSILIKLVSFDGFNISGTYFLASCSTDVIVLCLKILALVRSGKSDEKMVNTTLSVDFDALALALRALSLLDDLALINRQENNVVDDERRVAVLFDIFTLCSNQRSGGGKAMVAALCYSTNVEHLLEIFTFGSITILDKHVLDDIKTTLRHSVCYGYACEILLTLARASSLKQWTEPLRESIAQGTSPSAIHYLVQRLGYYLEKFKSSNDSPLSAITVLRLIDALLKENTENTGNGVFDDTMDKYELFSIFYDENGLQKIEDFLLCIATKHITQETEKNLYLASDSLICEMLLYSAVSIIETMVQSMCSCGKYVDMSPTSALLKIYSVFCCGYPNRYSTVKLKILGIFSLFVVMDLKENEHIQNKGRCPNFLRFFFECGLHPSTVIALSDILSQFLSTKILTRTSSSFGFSLESNEFNNRQFGEILLLQCSHYLRFIIMSGISSSITLRSSITTICLCLIRLSLPAANFVVNTIANYCLRSLLVSPASCVTECFNDDNSDSDTDENVRLNNDIRFGAAANFTVAACFKFLARFSNDVLFRYAFIPFLLSDSVFTVGVLKFFNVASQKTIPHVCFQKQIIVLFKNLCLTLNPESKTGALALSKTLYEKFCGTLVEHLGNKDQDFSTAVMSLMALYSIGCFTNTAKNIVLNAFVSRPDRLMLFIDRLCHIQGDSAELLKNALKTLMLILRDVFVYDDKLIKILQWTSRESDGDKVTTEKHPLLFICDLIEEREELTNCAEYIGFFKKTVNFTAESTKSVFSECDSNVEEWIPLKEFSTDVLNDTYKVDNLLEAVKECSVNCDLGTKFEPPAIELDLNALQAEFLQSSNAKFLKRSNYKVSDSTASAKCEGIFTFLLKKRLERDSVTETVIRA
uniref:ANK_REP_REGION domain-containing protein n=1 Tax=Syphacia muris TaxID=451379 RepID=A0A0N5A8Y3_9BILA